MAELRRALAQRFLAKAPAVAPAKQVLGGCVRVAGDSTHAERVVVWRVLRYRVEVARAALARATGVLLLAGSGGIKLEAHFYAL